jgi:outer membrane protein assembly factor BamB
VSVRIKSSPVSSLGAMVVLFLLASSSCSAVVSAAAADASPSTTSSSSSSPLAASSAAQSGAANWIGPGGNFPFNWDYSPQASLNLTNVGSLDLNWLFPLPGPIHPTVLGSSVIITPLIADGSVYYITSADELFAQNAGNGEVLWEKNLDLNYTYTGIGVAPEAQNLEGHYHAIWYTTDFESQPLIWVAGDNYTVFAFNAASGSQVFKLDYLPTNVTGNFGYYDPGGKQIIVDGAEGILVVATSGSEGTDAGRGFFEAWNITASPPTLMWRTFLLPPQDGSDPLWSIGSVENATYAWVFNGTSQIDLKTLPNSTLYSMLYDDWGNFGYDGVNSFAGTDGGWGGSDAFDPQTGMIYVGTGQPAPDWNATTRPGLDLWSSSILAIDVMTGKLVWGFQTSPHDLSDYDCSWSVMLANATVDNQNQKVVMKGCKNGYFYALDAATGRMLWYFDAPTIARVPDSQILDPLNKTDMDKPWANYPSDQPYIQNPCNSGGIESDPAYDPVNNIAIVATFNCPTVVEIDDTTGPGVTYGSFGRDLSYPPGNLAWNTTLYAIDVNTGKAIWHYDVPDIGFRGGVDISAGLVFMPSVDGYLRVLNEMTGELVLQKNIGGPLCTEPAIGQTVGGEEELVFPVCAGGESHASLPVNNGVMVALVPAASNQTVITTVAPATTTTTTTATTTMTSLVTTAPPSSSSGVPYPAFLAAVAVAAVFIVATGVLVAARRANARARPT